MATTIPYYIYCTVYESLREKSEHFDVVLVVDVRIFLVQEKSQTKRGLGELANQPHSAQAMAPTISFQTVCFLLASVLLYYQMNLAVLFKFVALDVIHF